MLINSLSLTNKCNSDREASLYAMQRGAESTPLSNRIPLLGLSMPQGGLCHARDGAQSFNRTRTGWGVLFQV